MYDLCVWVVIYIYDDVIFGFVSIYMVKGEKVFGFVLCDYFVSFLFDDIEMWGLFMVLFYVFVEWMFFNFYGE